MMQPKTISSPKVDALIFDLDGTLWDASVVSAEGWTKALKTLDPHCKEVTADQIRSVAGLPFWQCVEVLFKDKHTPSLESLLDQYEKDSFLQSSALLLYPQTKTTLQHLFKQYKLFIVSNCQSWYLKRFLQTQGILDFFCHCVCIGDTGLPKYKNIANLVAQFNLTRPVYIGDTRSDKEASELNQMPFIWAKYGFGKNMTHTLAIESIDQLIALVKDMEEHK